MRQTLSEQPDPRTLEQLREVLAFHQAALLSRNPEQEEYQIGGQHLAIRLGGPLEIEGDDETVQAIAFAVQGRLLVHNAAASLRDVFKGLGPQPPE
jgi:hypothetical protein